MRKFLVGGITVAGVVGAFAAAAVGQSPEAQTTFRIDAKVIPNKAGTPKKPQPVKIDTSVRFFTPDGVEKPIATGGRMLFPRHGSYNGNVLPRCSKKVLDRKGPPACPKRSRIGGGTGSAYADTIITYPRVEIFNGGPKLVLAYVTLYRPALVQIAIPVHIKELATGKWKYRVTFKIPRVLQIVAGVPIAPRTLHFTIGRENLITTTSCPKSRRWPYEVEVDFATGDPYTYRDSVPCRPSGS